MHQMGSEFYERVGALKTAGRPFAVATVINVKGSASAKAGSKAIIDEHGKNIFGWVGGGCAETFVAENALAAMAEGRTRIVQADLDDEIFGLGMPCGGVMDIYIEPHRAPETVAFHSEDVSEQEALSHLAGTLHLHATFSAGPRAHLSAPAGENAIYELAAGLARARGARFGSLREARGIYRSALPAPAGAVEELFILGSSRITEELASWGAAARWPVRVYGRNLDPALYPKQVVLEAAASDYEGFHVKPGSAVIVASHHKGDHEFIKRAFAGGAAYVGLVASPKRAGLVFEHLIATGFSEESLRHVYAPTGLDIGGISPREIALSVMAEIIGLSRRQV
ncbi:MAG: XdhC family protein [Proteobacteria bacterium]|nr:MAG: XdhC family protein [Pseudomonadota bacterium]